MDTANFAAKEYISPQVLNAAMVAIANNEALLAADLNTGSGLIAPDTLQFTFTGLTINVTVPLTFGILFPGTLGSTFAQAHGVITGQDTQTYSVPFNSLVPATGSVTAYLIASYVQIQQNPYQIIGPPPGHPDYNPNFIPYVGYSDIIDSIALTASLTPPNNTTTFSLGQLTLSAGQAAITGFSLFNWQRATRLPGINYSPIATNKTLTYSDAGVWQRDVSGGGVTYTLPPSLASWGLPFRIINSTAGGTTTILTQGSDVILGVPGTVTANVLTLSSGQSVSLGAADGYYYLLSNVGGIASIGLVTSSPGIAIYGSPLTKNGTIDIEISNVLNVIGAAGIVNANVTYLGYALYQDGNNAVALGAGGGFYNSNNQLQLWAAYGVTCGVGWGNYLVAYIDGYYGLGFGGAAGQQIYVVPGAGLTTGSGPLQVAFGQCIGNYGGAIGVNLGPMMQNYGNGIAPILGTGMGNWNNGIANLAWGWNQGGNPGYYEAPSGFIMQWGWVTVNGRSAAGVGFAVGFPNILVALTFAEVSSANGGPVLQFYGQNNGGFNMINRSYDTCTAYWMAYGW